MYDRFHELVADVIPHDGVVVSSYDERGLIRCEYAWVEGNKLDSAQLPPLPLNREGEGMQSRVIVSGEGLLVNDVAERVAKSGMRRAEFLQPALPGFAENRATSRSVEMVGLVSGPRRASSIACPISSAGLARSRLSVDR